MCGGGEGGGGGGGGEKAGQEQDFGFFLLADLPLWISISVMNLFVEKHTFNRSQAEGHIPWAPSTEPGEDGEKFRSPTRPSGEMLLDFASFLCRRAILPVSEVRGCRTSIDDLFPLFLVSFPSFGKIVYKVFCPLIFHFRFFWSSIRLEATFFDAGGAPRLAKVSPSETKLPFSSSLSSLKVATDTRSLETNGGWGKKPASRKIPNSHPYRNPPYVGNPNPPSSVSAAWPLFLRPCRVVKKKKRGREMTRRWI